MAWLRRTCVVLAGGTAAAAVALVVATAITAIVAAVAVVVAAFCAAHITPSAAAGKTPNTVVAVFTWVTIHTIGIIVARSICPRSIWAVVCP